MPKIKILHLFSDLLDLYGDLGNIKSLEYRSKKRGIDLTYQKYNIGDNLDFSDYNLIFMGGGSDREQQIASKDLLKQKNNIMDALSNGAFALLICGGYQLFGKYYEDISGNIIEGLGILDYYTKAGTQRCVGNILCETEIFGEKFEVLGFENHQGQTLEVKNPFAKVIKGYGNKITDLSENKFEGFCDGNILGTYVHGPLLPKNPKLTDAIIKTVVHKTDPNFILNNLNDDIEIKAFEIMKSRILNS